jgi:hypothetical protein
VPDGSEAMFGEAERQECPWHHRRELDRRPVQEPNNVMEHNA